MVARYRLPGTDAAADRGQQELRVSPAPFARRCEPNPETVLELSASGQLIPQPERSVSQH
jgi:hypothetical protein